jgi:hypothetical protein
MHLYRRFITQDRSVCFLTLTTMIPSDYQTAGTYVEIADLVVYCMRCGRLSSEQARHLWTTWRTFCHGDIPLVLVVSGADYHRGSTEKWWEANGEDLMNAVQVRFADHICLNTWDSARPS